MKRIAIASLLAIACIACSDQTLPLEPAAPSEAPPAAPASAPASSAVATPTAAPAAADITQQLDPVYPLPQPVPIPGPGTPPPGSRRPG